MFRLYSVSKVARVIGVLSIVLVASRAQTKPALDTYGNYIVRTADNLRWFNNNRDPDISHRTILLAAGTFDLSQSVTFPAQSERFTIRGQGQNTHIRMTVPGQDALIFHGYDVHIRDLRITRVLGSMEDNYTTAGAGIVLEKSTTRWIQDVTIHGFREGVIIRQSVLGETFPDNADTNSIENSDLSYNGTGVRIDGRNAHAVSIRRCILRLEWESGIHIWNVDNFQDKLGPQTGVIADNQIEGTGGPGVIIEHAGNLVITQNYFENNNLRSTPYPDAVIFLNDHFRRNVWHVQLNYNYFNLSRRSVDFPSGGDDYPAFKITYSKGLVMHRILQKDSDWWAGSIVADGMGNSWSDINMTENEANNYGRNYYGRGFCSDNVPDYVPGIEPATDKNGKVGLCPPPPR